MKPIKRRIGNFLTQKLPALYKLILLYNYFTTDVYILSFPKAGRTWLRMMIAKIFSMLQGSDTIGDFIEAAKHIKVNGKRLKVTFEHEDSRGTPYYALEKDKKRYRSKKVIFLARDPRDVMVSYYFEMTKRKGLSFPDISTFIRDKAYGIDTLIAYMNIWATSKDIPQDFLFISYEDLHRNPVKILCHVIEFIGVNGFNSDMLETAVNFSRFENMKNIEKRGGVDTPELTPTDPSDSDSFKTRKGLVGGYIDYFTKNDLDYINTKIKINLSAYFNYSQSCKN
ncbi:MAG: sulfotransferase domain-containing protein [Pseudomonadota bacterium]